MEGKVVKLCAEILLLSLHIYKRTIAPYTCICKPPVQTKHVRRRIIFLVCLIQYNAIFLVRP